MKRLNVVSDDDSIRRFFSAGCFAVGGASNRRQKFGNKIFRALNGVYSNVFPLNPVADVVEGTVAYPNLLSLPLIPESLCVVTPPEITLGMTKDAISLGVQNVWIQPGAEHPRATELLKESDVNFIGDGWCVLVELGKLNLFEGGLQS